MTLQEASIRQETPRTRRVLVIHNPASGQQGDDAVEVTIERCLSEYECSCEIRQTSGEGDAREWASQAAEQGFDLLLAAGGDGTVVECLSGLLSSQCPIPLMLVPLGTGNLLARSISLPFGVKEALNAGLTGKSRTFDVAHIVSHDRYFVIAAGVGLDAQVIQDADRQQKRRWGMLAYVSATLKHMFTRRNRSITLTLDGKQQQVHAHSVLAFNSGRISLAGLKLGPDSVPHDGWLHIAVLEKSSSWHTFGNLWHIFTRRFAEQAAPRYFKAKTLQLDARPPMNIQADGDVFGQTPMEIKILPEAIQLIVPANYDKS